MVRGDPQSDGRVVGTTNYRSSVPHCVGPRTRLRTALVIIITPSFSSACCATELRRDVETATIGAAYRHRALSAVDRQVRNLSRTAWQRQRPASRDATSASAVSRAPCARSTTVMPMVTRAKLPSFFSLRSCSGSCLLPGFDRLAADLKKRDRSAGDIVVEDADD